MEILEVSPANKKIPRYLCRALIDDDGTIYLPAKLLGSEMSVFLCMGFDGIPAAYYEGHLYAPADWIIGEEKNEAYKENVREIARKVRLRASE